MRILVTGDSGMIGSKLVKALIENGYYVVGLDRSGEDSITKNYVHYKVDLSDIDQLQDIVQCQKPDRVIHLAALAHTEGEPDLTWERYYHVNVECSRNIFLAAGERPVLYISTIDVYGFFDGKKPVNAFTALHPVTNYGRSKALAEEECKKLAHYTIFRLSPVYTDEVKRDIQKRYYLRFPTVAYKIGKGSYYEILNISKAIEEMVLWCGRDPQNETLILKDEVMMWTPDYIRREREQGRAKYILYFPRWIVKCGYFFLITILGKNEKTYLVNKAIYPLRSCDTI